MLLAGKWSFFGLSDLNKQDTKTTLNLTWPCSRCKLVSNKSSIANWEVFVAIVWMVKHELKNKVLMKKYKKKFTRIFMIWWDEGITHGRSDITFMISENIVVELIFLFFS